MVLEGNSMKYIKSNFILIFLAIFVCFQNLEAQIKIKNSVIGSGGGKVSDSSFRIIGTIGQSVVGRSSNNANTISGGFWSLVGGIVTSVEEIESESFPKEFRLEQNYPNPFNPTTTIIFMLPKSSDVTIKIFDLTGREITTLLNEEMQPGEYQIVFEAQDFPSGVYFYRIKTNTEGSPTFVKTKKMLLLK